jgi:hypothetical protein
MVAWYTAGTPYTAWLEVSSGGNFLMWAGELGKRECLTTNKKKQR